MTMQIIEYHNTKPWCWKSIWCNPNLTIDFINRHEPTDHNWRTISSNVAMTLQIIEQNLDKSWDWNCISETPNLTMKFIEKNLDNNWNWEKISCNRFGYKRVSKDEIQYCEFIKSIKLDIMKQALNPKRMESILCKYNYCIVQEIYNPLEG